MPAARKFLGMVANVGLALAAPALVLLLLNALLALVGYGTPTAFFLRGAPPFQHLRFANPDYALQFVPRSLSRSSQPIALAEKRDDTARVFVLGESAAAGDPEPAFGFPRALDALLREYTTGRRVEVVNTAMTAMNSHVIRRIAAECAEQRPDAFVIYMGNNEVVGPYGPRALPEAVYERPWLVRALMAARRSRLGQLVLSWAAGDADGRQWVGMEAFLDRQVPADDRRLARMYGYFEANLRDVLGSARAAGASVLLATVPTNLRSCAPFGSMHRPGLSPDELAQWERHFADGRAAQRAGDPSLASDAYGRAAAIDDHHADLAFVTGQCAAAQGDRAGAVGHWTKARDLDSLRFRADGRINGIVRRVASQAAAGGVTLVDLEQAVAAAGGGAPGDELFVDHVHLTFRGNVIAARVAFEALRDRLPGVRFLPLPDDGAVDAVVRRRLVYDARAALQVATLMYRRRTRPPFVGQLDHDADMAALRDRLGALRAAARGVSWEEREAALGSALELRPDDGTLVARLSEHYAAGGQGERALATIEEPLRLAPWDGVLRGGALDAFARAGRPAEAVALLTTRAGLEPMDRRQALSLVASKLIELGPKELAAPLLEEVLTLDAGDTQALTNLGALAVKRGDADTAVRYLTRALERSPRSGEALVNLAAAHAMQGRGEEAFRDYEAAVAAGPNYELAWVGLGLQRFTRGELRQGIADLTRAIELNPEYVDGYRMIAAAYERLNEPARAAEYLRLANAFQG